jgi:predicted Na+-dependent transporter
VWPEPGKAVASVVVGKSGHDPRGIRLFEFICNVNIFLVSGLTLRTGDFRGLMQEWKAPAYGLLTVLVMTPLLALGLKVRTRACA